MCITFGFTFFLRANLEIVKGLADRAAQGRACGNLGNTHYLLGNFSEAIVYHEQVGVGQKWLKNNYFYPLMPGALLDKCRLDL